MQTKTEQRRLNSEFIYISAALILFFVFLFVDTTAEGFRVRNYQYICIAAVFSLAVFAATARYYKKISFKTMIMIIFLIGLIIRIYYILYTPYSVRQHDVGGDEGHYSYIYTIFTTGRLPESYDYQFYHPPLHHFISAAMLKLSQMLNFGIERSFEGVQILTAFYSFVIMVVAYKILDEIGLKGRTMVIAVSIMAVHPTFIILSGSINNDVLSIMFLFIALLYTIKWYKDPGFKNIIVIAAAIGLGMMTKISVGMVAFVVAAVFLFKWVSLPKFYRQGKYYAQFAVFALICFPLALWHPIYNNIRLGQPIGYVTPVGLPDLSENYSALQRFFSVNLKELGSLYCSPWEDSNLLSYSFKCSVFGEFSFSEDLSLIGGMLLIFNIVTILLSLAAMVYVLIKDRDNNRHFFNLIMVFFWLVQIVSFISFNIKYPFGCTMDFRYIVPTILTGSYFLSVGLELLPDKQWSLYLKNFSYMSIFMFVLTSIWFYTSAV